MFSLINLFPKSPTRLLVQEQFITSSLGNTLMLKACGFIEQQQAEILDVDVNFLKMRLGQNWWRRLFQGSSAAPPLNVTLSFQELQPDLFTVSTVPRSRVLVTLQPVQAFLGGAEFHRATRRVLWQLRYHFMAMQ